jgi:hypothetical protein
MMNELLNQVTERTGLSPDQAKAAVDVVLGFLKARLPAPLAGNLDSLVGGGENVAAPAEDETGGGGLAGKATSMLGNLLR